MGSLDIEQAARASGLNARDIRLLIEAGQLPATRPAGRWLIEPRHLAAATSTRTGPSDARPIGADSSPEVTAPAPATDDDPATVLARLEEAEAEIADLRTERDELRLRLREQVASLQHSLEQSLHELDEARARVTELELRHTGASPRQALTPLFKATTQRRDIGGPQGAEG